MDLFSVKQLAGTKRPREEVATDLTTTHRTFPPTRLQTITNFGSRACQFIAERVARFLFGSRDNKEVAIVSVGCGKRRIIESPSRRLPGSFPSTPRRKVRHNTYGTTSRMDPYRPKNNFTIDIDDVDISALDCPQSAVSEALVQIRQDEIRAVQESREKKARVQSSIEEAIDVSITMEDAPPVKAKKNVRFVDPFTSVLTGEPVYLMPARKFNKDIQLNLPAQFAQPHNKEGTPQEDDLSILTPERHYEKLENENREYKNTEPATDNVGGLLDGLRQWAPNAIAKVEDGAEIVRNYFERFVIKDLIEKRKEKEAAIEAERKRQEEERLRLEALEQERLEAERLAEEARVQAELERQRAEEEKQRRARAAKNLIIDLSPAMAKNVKDAMAVKHADTFVTPEPGTRLTRRDMGFILPQKNNRMDRADGWLNDEVVNLFLTKLCEKAHKAANHIPDKTRSHKYYAFPSQFLPSIAKKGPASVSRWGRRAGMVGDGIMQADLIFVPCNINGNHWTLATISPKDLAITYYDSLGGAGKREIALIRSFLKDQLKAGYDENAWKEVKGGTAHQDNGSDCGVFTVFNALAVVRGVPPHEVVTAARMPAARKHMVGVLVSGGFTGEFDW